jgi:hypothetical protein
MNPLTKVLELKRRFALVISALFLLALAAAQPHRVHHFFEDIDRAHHHDEADSNHDEHSKGPAKAPQTECVVQAVSQHCSAIPVAVAQIPIIASAVNAQLPVLRRWVYHFSASPFLQRAPPAISSSFSI